MTDSAQPLPASGYRISRIYVARQSQSLLQNEAGDEQPDEREVKFSWDWRVTEAPSFEVFLGITIGASRSCTEVLEIGLVGAFTAQGEPDVDLRSFVHCNAIATLLPFAREGLASLSAKGPFGSYYLPLLNAVKISQELEYDASTGAKQLAKDPAMLKSVEVAGSEE